MRILIISIILLVPTLGLSQSLGSQRSGISAFPFLKPELSPRSIGMGGAQISSRGDGYAMHWNPGSMTDVDDITLALSNTLLPAGINFSFIGATLPSKKNGSWGISMATLSTEQMEKRTVFQPDGTGEYFSVFNAAIGLSFARRISEYFSFGGTVKYVQERLAEFSAHTAVMDLGFQYNTKYKDLNFSAVIQNFGPNSTIHGTFKPSSFFFEERKTEGYPPPTVFKLGVSMIPYKKGLHQIVTAVQLNHPNDNAENLRFGVEYSYRKTFILRTGYKVNVVDEKVPTFGFGLLTRLLNRPLRIDYAANFHNRLGVYQSIGISYAFSKKAVDETR